MGSGEAVTPTKTAKISAQDQPTAPSSYAEWIASFQAYYNGASPPPGYFPPSMAPPGAQPHPYMWAGQPQVVPPYGTHPPYSPMYAGGHAYGHPTLPQGPHSYPYGIMSPGSAVEATQTTTSEADCKSSDGKEQSPLKKSKANAGSPKKPKKKTDGNSKGTSASLNSTLSQSAESASDGSSNGSKEDNGKSAQPSLTCHQMVEKRSLEQTLEGRPPGALVPSTSLNVGMDYWATATQGASAGVKGKHNPLMTQALMPTFPSGPFLAQDERELKRQKRKQSNRESARRSRLRKQAECEELAARVDSLTSENLALRTEINRLVEEQNKLSTENAALSEELEKITGNKAGDGKYQASNEASAGQFQQRENGKVLDAV